MDFNVSQADIDAAKQSILNMAAQAGAQHQPEVRIVVPTSVKIAGGILTASIVLLVIGSFRKK